jgi:hypothetical protein
MNRTRYGVKNRRSMARQKTLTAAQLRDYRATGNLPAEETAVASPAPRGARKKVVRARPRQVPGRMNKTEQAVAEQYLNPLVQSGEVLQWMFEPVSLRLAKNTFYRPDFLVVRPEGVEVLEVKGTHFEDDARAKWKAAADLYWFYLFRWVAVTVKRGEIVDMKWEEYKA